MHNCHLTQRGQKSSVESLGLLLHSEAENQAGKVSSMPSTLQKELFAAVVHLLTAVGIFSELSSPSGKKLLSPY